MITRTSIPVLNPTPNQVDFWSDFPVEDLVSVGFGGFDELWTDGFWITKKTQIEEFDL